MTNPDTEQDFQEYASIANDLASQAQHIVEVLGENLEQEEELSATDEILHALVEVLNIQVQLHAIDLVTDLEDDDDDDEGDED
jgi:hypothetical protein